jgi:hypothetical protein
MANLFLEASLATGLMGEYVDAVERNVFGLEHCSTQEFCQSEVEHLVLIGDRRQ